MHCASDFQDCSVVLQLSHERRVALHLSTDVLGALDTERCGTRVRREQPENLEHRGEIGTELVLAKAIDLDRGAHALRQLRVACCDGVPLMFGGVLRYTKDTDSLVERQPLSSIVELPKHS